MTKAIGYLLMIAGVLAIAMTLEPVKKIINLTLPSALTNNYLMIGGTVLVIFGVVLSMKGGSLRQSSEVPIYRGKNIVGYRRTRR